MTALESITVILIEAFRIDDQNIFFERTGTHSDLFR